jgi:hypothetical protein
MQNTKVSSYLKTSSATSTPGTKDGKEREKEENFYILGLVKDRFGTAPKARSIKQ